MPRGLRLGSVAALLLAALLLSSPGRAEAHAGLVGSDPIAGAQLGAAPTEVVLAFTEPPEPSLTTLEVTSDEGEAIRTGPAAAVAGAPGSISIPMPKLGRGVYTVDYRVVSAIDGHATEGTLAFGVGVAPTGAAAVAATDAPTGSAFEVASRWILLLGLVALLGGAVASVAGFGGRAGADLLLPACGLGASVAGLLLLGEAQRRVAGYPLADIFGTPVGDALLRRAGGIALAGIGLLIAWRLPRVRRLGATLAALGALGAVAVHVEAGHAGAGGWPEALTVSAQVAHFAAAAVWFGGLAALLLGLRGAPPEEGRAAVGRFAGAAAAALVVVLVTGVLRSIDELASVGDLVETGYGLALIAKLALFVLIALIALRSRRRAGDVSARGPAGVIRSGRAELALAVIALGVAALLGTIAPPDAGEAAAAQAGISATGSDFGTTVRAELTAASDQPGPNLFEVEVEDYDTGEPVEAERVSLRFEPADDPDVEPTELRLSADGAGDYSGTGPNLAVDGRWRVTVQIERGGDSVDVPLELDLPIPEQFIAVQEIPGEAPEYTLQTTGGYIRLSPHPLEAGPSKVALTVFTEFSAEARVADIVLTAAAGDGPPDRVPLSRRGPGSFVAHGDLTAGPVTMTVIAYTRDGTRLRGFFELDVPSP